MPPPGFLVVAAVLAIQVVIAAAAAFGPRPSPYGWQMYSATPPIPSAWAVENGDAVALDVDALLVNARVEIDYVAMLRAQGCAHTGADAIRIRLSDGRVDEVACP